MTEQTLFLFFYLSFHLSNKSHDESITLWQEWQMGLLTIVLSSAIIFNNL